MANPDRVTWQCPDLRIYGAQIPKVMATASLKKPLILGFASYFIGQSILTLIPAPQGGLAFSGYAFLFLSLVFDGFGAGILAMLAESLVALHVDRDERARVMAIQRIPHPTLRTHRGTYPIGDTL